MCKVVKKMLGKKVDVSKNRGGYDEYKWGDSQYATTPKGEPVQYLKGKKSKKKTPKDIIDNINKKFK